MRLMRKEFLNFDRRAARLSSAGGERLVGRANFAPRGGEMFQMDDLVGVLLFGTEGGWRIEWESHRVRFSFDTLKTAIYPKKPILEPEVWQYYLERILYSGSLRTIVAPTSFARAMAKASA